MHEHCETIKVLSFSVNIVPIIFALLCPCTGTWEFPFNQVYYKVKSNTKWLKNQIDVWRMKKGNCSRYLFTFSNHMRQVQRCHVSQVFSNLVSKVPKSELGKELWNLPGGCYAVDYFSTMSTKNGANYVMPCELQDT